MRFSSPLFALLFLTATVAQAEWASLWSLGKQDGTDAGFGWQSYAGNTSPTASSQTVRDNDYFFAGTYAAPVGVVAANEPLSNFEGALSYDDATERLHFILTAAQASSTAQLRFNVSTIWGGYDNGRNFGTHQLRVQLNGTTVTTFSFNESKTLTITFNAAPAALAGANVLEIVRVGGSPNGWFFMDTLSLETNATALVDADGDGLPQIWEQSHGLNDNFAGDASLDFDHDGLTNSQEFTKGTDPQSSDTDADGVTDNLELTTNPLVADTDGDSLSDGFEVAQGLNPLLVDSDGDGAADAWEERVGTLAGSASSVPPPFASAIGLHFTSEIAVANIMSPYEVTGLVPQMNWNNTMVLSQWSAAAITGSTADIVSPAAAVLKNSAGASTSATVSWSAPATWASGNSGGATQNLLNGGLWTNSDTTQATVTFANVPFTNYDVIVYFGSSYDFAEGEVVCTPSVAREGRFLTNSAAPQSEIVELRYPTSAAYAGTFHRRQGNAVRFRVNGSNSCTVKLYRNSWHEAGIHAVQIVDANADSDGDGMPDWYEVTHKLRPNFNDASLDPEGDTLSNINEFLRGTDPNRSDTDNDGLSDAVETDTGTFVSASLTGTDPLNADTDGDGLSDGAEVNRLPAKTNPFLADSDADGVRDKDEIAQRTDPTSTNATASLMPSVTGATSKTFDWTLFLQLIWNHERGVFTDGEWGDSHMVWLGVKNRQAGGDALNVSVRMVENRVTALFNSSHNAAFSGPSTPTDDIWHSDWNRPPTDLRAAMGFSGHGTQDVSSRLRYRVHGTTTGSRSAWSITFSVFNLDTNQTVMTQTFNNCTLETNAHNATATWTDNDDVPNQLYMDVHAGIDLYLLSSTSSPSIETLPALAGAKDTDNDGMPDVWETANSFNLSSATDASLDADGDGLTNVREFDLGTNPRNADTDGDGVRDDIEVATRSNPLLASSKPPLWNGVPAGVSGEDLNGNGISDAFELWLGRFDLLGSADTDGDGHSNADESIAGTDPENASSYLWADQFRSGNDLTFCWPRIFNKSHQVQQSTDLVNWSNVTGSPSIVGDEFRMTITNPFVAAKKFYRASVTNVDTDGDGVSDWAEANVLGSSSSSANSLGSAVQINSGGTTISGDYASFVQRMQGGGSTGGFAGAATAAAGVSKESASRFLMQASFGATLEDIDRVQQLGFEGWINDQLTQPATLHSTYAKAINADLFGPQTDMTYSAGTDNSFLFGHNLNTAFARAAIGGSDQLRQRVAFALSQILVTSRRDASLENQVLGMADYYDIFVKRAFGNYYDVLMDVTLHPCMGRYLSHVGNQKADPSINQYPDENYAREVMQLFSIGLWQLNPDGTRVTNGSGANLPTYSNTEITQLARVLTGLWFGQHEWAQGGWQTNDYSTPMTMHADRHDFAAKTLLNGYHIPAREPTNEAAMQDIRDAIRHLFNHPNCGPFICKQLIQFLVTDNPSPAYVQRVASIFANNGNGVRGDLAAVVKAILLDNDARNPATSLHDASFGRLKEPVTRTMAMARAFGMKDVPNLLWWNWSEFYDAARQEPTYSPSVFNFYRPEYKAPGLLTANQKNGPVFQITDSFSSIAFPNKLWEMVNEGFHVWHTYSFPLNCSREQALAATPEKLIDHLNLLFCAGQMTLGSRTIILNAINSIPVSQPDARARIAAYLTLVCPEGAVMK